MGEKSERILRFEYILEHDAGKSINVFFLQKCNWEDMVNTSGDPTILNLEVVASEFSSPALHTCAECAAGSGIYNPNPGIDIVRYDPKDYPFKYNVDHYIVNEDIIKDYSLMTKIYSVLPDENPRNIIAELSNYVVVIGPYKENDNHWHKDIPAGIKNAKPKID